jgi:gas vesicle protein
MSDENHAAEFLAGFMIGALVGAAVALLFAPRSGDQTRTMIRERGIELGHQAEDLQMQARERAEALQTQARERADALQSNLKQAVEEGKAAAAERREELLAQLEPEQPGEPAVE